LIYFKDKRHQDPYIGAQLWPNGLRLLKKLDIFKHHFRPTPKQKGSKSHGIKTKVTTRSDMSVSYYGELRHSYYTRRRWA